MKTNEERGREREVGLEEGMRSSGNEYCGVKVIGIKWVSKRKRGVGRDQQEGKT